MRRSLTVMLDLGCFLGWVQFVPAQDDVRAILEKAIKAEGKADQADKYRAARFKSKGAVYQIEGATFTDEETIQDFDKVKSVQVISINDQKISYTMGFDGQKAWVKADGFALDESEINLTAHIM